MQNDAVFGCLHVFVRSGSVWCIDAGIDEPIGTVLQSRNINHKDFLDMVGIVDFLYFDTEIVNWNRKTRSMTKLTQMLASLPYVGDQPASSDMVCATTRLIAGRTNQSQPMQSGIEVPTPYLLSRVLPITFWSSMQRQSNARNRSCVCKGMVSVYLVWTEYWATHPTGVSIYVEDKLTVN